MEKLKKGLVWCSVAVAAVVICIIVWNRWFGTTRIAFVNYRPITLGQVSKANISSKIRIEELSINNLDRLRRYDMVFVNGMGLRIVQQQRKYIESAAAKGVPVYTSMATSPANDICSLDSLQTAAIEGYLGNGGQRNYRNMLLYVRKYIDEKPFFSEEPEAARENNPGLLYHADLSDPETDALEFDSVSGYQAFLDRNGLLKDGAPGIVVTGVMGEPSELIRSLEESGSNVYPVRDMRTFITLGHADSVAVSAVVNMAHGRLGDYMVEYLKRKNIPMFSTIDVNGPVEEWEDSPAGIGGGFLSQSVVTPEIDGAIRPYALFGTYRDGDGLPYVKTMPDRLKDFVQTVNSHIGLQRKPNSEKKVAIYYYKGFGKNALSAAGMEVAPSLYNLLSRMKKEGYDVSGLPSSAEGLEHLIQRQGSVYGTYAENATRGYMQNGNPVHVTSDEFSTWVKEAGIRPEKYEEVVSAFGEFPGEYLVADDGSLCVTCIRLGNVVLLPQPAAGGGDDAFAMVHGTQAAPPYPYIASYLWTRFGFGADAIIHFGTHGSLEFTPGKQVALGNSDWADRLVGPMPHFYIYSIGDVGEGMIAKRRSYAVLQSHLTPPFMESNVRETYRELCDAVKGYNKVLSGEGSDANALGQASLQVKRLAVKLGLHRDLGLDSLMTVPYTEDEVGRIENFAEELISEKVTGQLYVIGEPYEPSRIESSVYAMAVEPVAYSLLALDKLRGRAPADMEKHRSQFSARYLEPARSLVGKILADPSISNDRLVCKEAGISAEELASAREVQRSLQAPSGGMMAMMMQARSAKKEYTDEEKNFSGAIMELEQAILNVNNYRKDLQESPEAELRAIMNSLAGGYTAPSPGGDPIANPNALPTGRNLFAINAETVPGEDAWEKGVALAKNTIEMYRRHHNDSIPRKVSYTLWSGEFIETGGATVAQVLYMLGVEPVRDAFGRVMDLRLIPSAELGRPRIDVVVQTSGQLRDIAASRLFLINRAVEMAAASSDDIYGNMVAEGVVESERVLIEKGLTPKEAREVSVYRVFGGLNGDYGTGIQDMVMSGDRWEDEKEIAQVYLNNMNAFYGNEEKWEEVAKYAFEAALTRTDAVVQPRQSNTWGALSLDHVYEFMGGLDLAVRNVTGKEPDAYLSDYRNRNNFRMQELKEAIGVESRTTILNPSYIKEQMKGGAGSANTISGIVSNTYGWNVMKPSAVDDRLWDDIYGVYVKDRYSLGVKEFFAQTNPAALQEMTAVMLESARKGLWNASDQQISDIAALHTELVEKYQPSCSGFVCDNAKLRQFISSRVDANTAAAYSRSIDNIRNVPAEDAGGGVVMKREDISMAPETVTNTLSNAVVAVVVVVFIIAVALIIRKRRKDNV